MTTKRNPPVRSKEAIKKDAQRKRAALLAEIEKAKDGIAISELCALTGITKHSASVHLQKLKHAKKIYSLGQGTAIVWKSEARAANLDHHDKAFMQAQSIWQVGYRYFQQYGSQA